jgi:hypothetical protein
MLADERRRASRVPYMVSIYELKRLHVEGTVRDLSETGFGVRGIKATVGEVKTFIIPVEEVVDIDALIFAGTCRWASRDTDGQWLTGFKLTKISEENLRHLRRLIRFLAEEDGG